MIFDPYAVLGIARTADQSALKARYRQLALRHHPDNGSQPDAARMVELNAAWTALKTPERRAETDRTLVPEPVTEPRTGASDSTRTRPPSTRRQRSPRPSSGTTGPNRAAGTATPAASTRPASASIPPFRPPVTIADRSFAPLVQPGKVTEIRARRRRSRPSA
jgi:curved DNA-binding protein CbpA